MRYLERVLGAEGYEPMILEAAPGWGNLVARFKGDGTLPPFLLFSHTDVVPVEAEHWTHSPFSGDLADGCVWGRGTLDMKRHRHAHPTQRRSSAQYMLSGATDAKLAARLGIKSYGFSPLKLQVGEPFNELIHGHDERVPVRALAFGVSAL